jgi:hypothetical protein
MPTEDEMTLDERRKYLKRMKPRYMKAKRGERSALLSEMEQVSGMHRKSLTRLLHAESLERKKRQSPRCRSYGKAVEEVIVSVWESLDYICAERLTPILLTMAQHLARFGAVKLTREVEEQLQTISRATVSRVLRAYRSRRRRLPQKGAERANQVTKGVPMGRLAWDLKEPGQGAGGSGVSQWREHDRRAWAYHPDGGCGHGLERARGRDGAWTTRYGGWL